MTTPNYYASTSGILVDRFLKYGLFAFGYGAGLAIFRDHDKATRWSQAACALGAAVITTAFLGLESEKIDDSGRMAIAAAMGVDSNKIEFSDYKNSSNIILRKAHNDLTHLQWYRYGTDALFMLPSIVEAVYGGVHGKTFDDSGKYVGREHGTQIFPPSREVQKSLDRKGGKYNPKEYSRAVSFFQGHNGWAHSPYAAKAVYWVYETFFVPKTAYYDVIKLRENLETSGKDIVANDLKGIYQRARTDRKLPIVGPVSFTKGLQIVSPTARQENDSLRELLTRMADAYNKHDGKFSIAEIVYLIGENKINIYAADNKTFSPEAVAQSHREIDKVLALGLEGISKENQLHRAQSAPGKTTDNQRSFTERVGNKTVNTIQGILTKAKLIPKRPEEYISERDPTNLIGVGHTGMN